MQLAGAGGLLNVKTFDALEISCVWGTHEGLNKAKVVSMWPEHN